MAGIRAKQLQDDTFDATTQGRAPFGAGLFDAALADSVFGAQAIDGSKIKSGDVGADQLAATAFGDGLTGGAGTAVSVQPNTTDGGGVPGVEVGANGLRLAAPAASSGLTGGAGSALAVQPTTGVVVGPSGVGFDTAAALTMTGVHTHTPDTLQVVGTPDSANDAANKAYVDNALSGLTWLPPVGCVCLLGNQTVAQINALGDLANPADSRVYVVTDAGTLTQGSLAVTAGDIVQWDDANSQWIKVRTAVGGFPPAGTRFVLSTGQALVAPYTDGVDDGKIGEFDGTSLTAPLSNPNDGDAVLVTGFPGETQPVLDNQAFVYNGTIPTGAWVQFTGGGGINAGQGLALTGNTLNVGDVNKGVQANADDLQIDASEIAGSGLQQQAGVGNEHLLEVQPNVTDGGGVAGLEASANGVRIAATAAGAGLAGGGGAALSIGDADRGVQVNADDLEIDASEVAAASGGLKAGANSWQLAVEPADFAGTGLEDDGSDNLRIATSAAGNGLTGGGGSALAVQPDAVTGGDNAAVSVGANGVSLDVTDLDGDHLVIDFVPVNYTRDSGPAEAQSIQDLTAHLKGIDDALQAAGGIFRQEQVASQNVTTDTALTDTLNNTPVSNESVKLFLNGVLLLQGAAPLGAYTVSGTTITYLAGTGSAPELDTQDTLIATYES